MSAAVFYENSESPKTVAALGLFHGASDLTRTGDLLITRVRKPMPFRFISLYFVLLIPEIAVV